MPKPVVDGVEREWTRGDVVQITNNEHDWYPALVIVDQIKSFGVRGYILHVTGEGVFPSYIKLENADIEFIGTAAIAKRNEEIESQN